MSQEEELHGQFENISQTFNELLILSENLDNNYQKLLSELAVSEDQISGFLSNPVNFTEEEWSELESEKQKMQEMLEVQLSHLQDPKAMKKKYSERKRIKNNWLFVR